MLNNIDALIIYNSPDIVDKREWGFYLGYFAKGTKETDANNCMIVEMRTIDNITTKKYAHGENASFLYTWSERENYDYEFPLKNI